MRYLNCKEIYDAIKEWGIKETNTREYAYEFQLKNGQYIYVKRLLDTQKRNPEPLRLMIHPCFIALKEDLLSFENIEFSFEEMGNMNSAFAQFPKSSQSQCDENPIKYGIGVNFQDKRSLLKLIVFIESV